jgi:hypothetical protein
VPNPGPGQGIPQLLDDVMDVLLFFDKKRIVDTGEVTLYPSEVHMLVRALQGVSLTDIVDGPCGNRFPDQ